MFGYPPETPEAQRPAVRRRALPGRHRLAPHSSSGSRATDPCTDYLLRLRRADSSRGLGRGDGARRAAGADGRLRVEALMRDVSERKKLEDQTRDLYHQLPQAEKLAALGQTISGVAHELNNPLATILPGPSGFAAPALDDATRRGLTPSSASPSARRASSATC